MILQSIPPIHQIKQHRYLLLFLVLILPFLIGIGFSIGFNKQASAAVIIDSQTGSDTVGSWTHRINDNPNRVLVVATNGSVSSVTYNGVPLTLLASDTSLNEAGSVGIWYMKNPPVGTYTVRLTGGSRGVSTTYHNVDQTNTFGRVASNSDVKNTAQSPVIVSGGAFTNPGQLVFEITNFVVQSGSPPTTIAPLTGQSLGMSSIQSGNFLGTSTKNASSGTATNTGWTLTIDSQISIDSIRLSMGINPLPTSPTATPPPPVSGGTIVNLNFGINNLHPWIQSVCGDIRMDNGITNLQPPGQSTIITNTSCTNPGVIYSGNASSSFGQGQPSSTGWVVGGNTYPEVYTPPNSGGIFSSYNYLSDKAQTTDIPPITLATVCNVSSCTLPSNLAPGVYQATSDVNLNAYSFPVNSHYVFLINGNLTIRGNVLTPVSSSSVFSVRGNIIVPSTVGSPAAIITANLSGIFSTDRSFILQGNNNCTDLRLNLEGTLIVNAGRTGGSLQNNRDLCANNATTPTIRLTQRLDYVLNLPDFVRLQRTTLEEVAP